MLVFNCEGIFDFDQHQKDLLTRKFSKSGAKVMPHEICNLLSIDKIDAIAMLSALRAANFSDNYIIVYHSCEPDYAVEYIPFEQGFPDQPWFCENCQEEVEDMSELSFGLMCISKASIRFI